MKIDNLFRITQDIWLSMTYVGEKRVNKELETALYKAASADQAFENYKRTLISLAKRAIYSSRAARS